MRLEHADRVYKNSELLDHSFSFCLVDWFYGNKNWYISCF